MFKAIRMSWMALAFFTWAVLSLPSSGQNYVLNETFNAGTNPGWLFSTVAGGNDWKVVTTGGVADGPCLYNKYMGSTGIPNFALSPGITLEAGMTYTARFSIKGGALNRRNFFVAFNSTRARNGSETLITQVNNVGTSMTTYSANFTVPSTGTYYMLYYLTYIGNATYSTIHLDDVQVFSTNTPPTVSLTYPSAATTLTVGSVATLTATATDNEGAVDSVVFFNNGTRLGKDVTSPYSLDYAVPAGTSSITARAYDGQGANTLSGANVITGNYAPTVSLTAPLTQTLLVSGTVQLAATAGDQDGTVSKVEFFVDDVKVGEDVTAPYAIDWAATSGNHAITVVATDNSGATKTSNVANVEVTDRPTVSFDTPANNATVEAGNIYLRVSAADTDGYVDRVIFYNGSTVIGVDSVAPYLLVYNMMVGSYPNLKAVALDNKGVASTEATLSLTVVSGVAAQLFNNDFNTALNGFFLANPTTGNLWKYNTGAGVDNTNCLYSKLAPTNDFIASPLVALSGTKEYNVVWKGRLNKGTNGRAIVVGYNTTRSRTGMVKVDSINLPVNGYSQPPFTTYASKVSPPADGNYYIIWYASGSGYVATYLDDISMERNLMPTVSVTSPANNASFNEGSPITLTADAADADGSVKKVEFFDGATKLGEDTSAPYAFTWIKYLPGPKTITARATDNRGNVVTSAGVNIQINFSDGTYEPYLHWSFEKGVSPWVAGPNTAVQTKNTQGFNGTNCYWLYTITSGTTGSVVSPKLYLFANTTYKFEYRPEPNSTSNRTVRWYINTSENVSTATQLHSWTGNSTNDFAKQTFTFTVPADGAYYLMWNTSNTGYTQVFMDENRLIGNINSAPQVATVTPASNVVVGEGGKIKFSATATDPDGQLVYVGFFVDGVEIGRDSIAPYELSTTSITPGAHTWYAEAKDDRSGFGASTPLNFTVDPNRISAASYLGGSGANDVRGTLILADGTIVLAANISDATPGNVTPVLLNGATATSGGAIIRLSNNGQTVLSVTRVAGLIADMSKDAADNLYVACGYGGLLKLNPTADAVLWSKTFAKAVLRVDAGQTGYTAIMTAPTEAYESFTITNVTIYIHDAAGTELAAYGGPSQYNHDVCLDEATQTVVSIGTKNFYTSSSGGSSLPVYVAACQARDFSGTLKYTMYDWIGDNTSPRWLNRSENNMADVRSSRCMMGHDGKLYILFETFGGNHHLRYDPFDIMKPVPIVGGDQYFAMQNTGTETHIFIGKYDPADGRYLLGQNLTGRRTNGAGNTITGNSAGLAIDNLSRVYITTATASGIPINYEYDAGAYSGGAALFILSPDFKVRDVVTRFATDGGGFSVAVKDDQFVLGGKVLSTDLFTRNALQASMNGTQDGFFVVGNLSSRFSYQPGVHPRLLFTAAELPAIRAKLTQAPFDAMFAKLQSVLMLDHNTKGPIDTADAYDVSTLAHNYANLYVLTGNEYYAIQAKRWVDTVINSLEVAPWASSSLKGLTSYYTAVKVALVFDFCASSPNWDNGFKYMVSSRLRDMADMITTNGGTEQASDAASNWQGSRGASAAMAYLAIDHTYSASNYNSSHSKLSSYILNNLGSLTGSKGWNVEGLGYTYYPWGPIIGPYAIASRNVAGNNVRNTPAVRNQYWTGWAVNSTAMNLAGFNGFRPDFSDDNPHISGEGFLGQSFYFMDSVLLGGARYCYDRLVGSLNANPTYDAARGGAIFSILYYPSTTTAVDPHTLTAWKANFLDQSGNGFYTYRNAYQNADDHIAQFRAKHRNSASSHDAPDGLGFRIIGHGRPWAVGGGRNAPASNRLQNGLYVVNPYSGSVTGNRNLGTIQGTPVSMTDGSGHAIASMTTNSVGVGSHKRWFVANYNAAQTTADAVYIVGDESTNGQFWALNTHEDHVITTSGNTFTITAPDGSSMKGTVLQPTTNFRFEVTTQARGSNYGDKANNQCLNLQADNGDYLIVFTLAKSGQSHPAISYTGTGVTNAAVTVGTMTFTLQSTNVTYTSGARLTSLQGQSQLGGLLMVYPNHTNGQDLNVRLDEQYANQDMTLTLTDVTGKTWAQQHGMSQLENRIQLQGLPAGMYHLRVDLPQGTRTVKVMVSH